MNKEDLPKLSPPWFTFYNFVKHSIGNDTCVKVLDMKEVSDFEYIIPIKVWDLDKAIALATIMELHKNFGNINVCIKIYFGGQVVKPKKAPENVEEMLEIFEDALDTNCYFQFVESVKIFAASIIFPVFKKSVIQFFNDDISDLFSNFNGVAAKVFIEVLKPKIGNFTINPSTAI